MRRVLLLAALTPLARAAPFSVPLDQFPVAPVAPAAPPGSTLVVHYLGVGGFLLKHGTTSSSPRRCTRTPGSWKSPSTTRSRFTFAAEGEPAAAP